MDPGLRTILAAELGNGGLQPQPASHLQRGSLILFEGMDLLLDEERGFVSVLADLIEDSKVGAERGQYL